AFPALDARRPKLVPRASRDRGRTEVPWLSAVPIMAAGAGLPGLGGPSSRIERPRPRPTPGDAPEMTLPVVRRSNARMGRSPATRCMRNAAAVLALVLTASTGVAMPRGLRRPRTVPHAAQGAQPGPACRPGGTAPQLSYHGGDLVAHAAVFVLFWGSEWQGDPEHQAAAAALRAFFQTAGTSPYACSLREFSVPGVPIDTGSFLGDAVITVPPVSPPETELEDDVIRGRIADEVSAQRAPAPTADTVYVVVPPKGVPVRSFGE